MCLTSLPSTGCEQSYQNIMFIIHNWTTARLCNETKEEERCLLTLFLNISLFSITFIAKLCLSQSCWSWGTPWFITSTTVWRKRRSGAACPDFLTSWQTDKPASTVLRGETVLYMRGKLFKLILQPWKSQALEFLWNLSANTFQFVHKTINAEYCDGEFK